jgi:hypothetical protein
MVRQEKCCVGLTPIIASWCVNRRLQNTQAVRLSVNLPLVPRRTISKGVLHPATPLGSRRGISRGRTSTRRGRDWILTARFFPELWTFRTPCPNPLSRSLPREALRFTYRRWPLMSVRGSYLVASHTGGSSGVVHSTRCRLSFGVILSPSQSFACYLS